MHRSARLASALPLLVLTSCALGPGIFGSQSDEESRRDAFDVPACIAATGETHPDANVLADETGRASVESVGPPCERTFSLASTAVRRDDLPASPRVLREHVGAQNVQTTNPLFDALYQLALDEAAEDSVSQIQDGAFNDGSELSCPDGGCFETGRKWTYVWTRDTSYSADLGLGWVDPVRAKNSLEFKLSPRRDGSNLQIVQDTGTGGSYPISTDRAVWALGALETLQHLTGDARTKFRDAALEASKNTIEHDRAVVYDPRDGLYRGEQSFLDWREQSYPGWTATNTVHIGMSKSLSTNLAHLALLDLAGALAGEVGDAKTAETMKTRSTALRAAARARFWLPEEGLFSTFVTTELDPSPARHYDLLGTSLAVLLDVASPDEAQAAIESYPTLPYGPPVLFPEQKDTPVYHNRAIWPFVTAYWAKAARKTGNDAAFDTAIRSLVRVAALNLSNIENLEVVSGRPLVQDGATSGPVVNSQRQLWSVAGYLGTVVSGLFGVEAVSGGVRVSPFVTRGLHASLFRGATSIALNDLPLRGKTLSVVMKLPPASADAGGAYRVAHVRLNGVELSGSFAADDDLASRNLFEVELASAGAGPARLRTISDVSDYRSIFAPRTPSIASLALGADGRVSLTADISGEDPSGLTWSVYRDGERVAADLPASATVWSDPASEGEATPSHCYSIETRYAVTGNVSQHAQPSCFWGSRYERIASVTASDFSVIGGDLVTSYGRTFYESWGDPGHEIAATFLASRSGEHLVQAVYGNGAGSINTGITCAVKHVTVDEMPRGATVGDGYLLMPQRNDWASWGDSSFVRVRLEAGKTYRVRLSHDARSVNMSAFQHFAAYTAGTGGRSGPFFRVNVAELKLLALVP
jgi:hypothetical protein